MNSEMRELIAKWREMAARGPDPNYDEHGIGPEALASCADELEALLDRTEAGADGAVAPADLARWLTEKLLSFDENRYRRELDTLHLRMAFAALPPLYTHPQDASGDVEIAVAALREIYETGMYPEGHTLAGEHAYKGEYHADCIGIAERALAAMQAKEAK